MVRQLIALSLLLPLLAFSAEFTATVNKNQMQQSESLVLNLMLKGATAVQPPQVDILNGAFSIYSQQQSSNVVMVNGQFSSNSTWRLVLLPLNSGEILIPSIEIQTNEGLLSTTPFTIQVAPGQSQNTSGSTTDAPVTFKTEISRLKPYINEPFIFSIKLFSPHDLYNVEMQKINLENAIVEKSGEINVTKQIVNGVPVNIIEANYQITPLKSGPFKIPSLMIQGAIAGKKESRRGSMFDDEFDPFAMFNGFNSLTPFAVKSEEIDLQIEPSVPSVNPWLPAKHLSIEELWNENLEYKVGEPISRTIKIKAEGVNVNMLPSFEDRLRNSEQFKVYADKPQLDTRQNGHAIISERTEAYTIIAQQSGNLELPEISVVWWNVETNEKVISSLPARHLNVLPSNDQESLNDVKTSQDHHESRFLADEQTSNDTSRVLYIIVILLTLSLLALLCWVLLLQKKLNQSTTRLNPELVQKPVLQQSATRPKKNKFQNLNPS